MHFSITFQSRPSDKAPAGEGCDLDYTMGDGVSMNVDVAISNSLGFGGHNASLIVKKFSE